MEVRRPSKYIVSDEHRFVYFVVQKVACSSIKTALLPLFDFDVEWSELVRKDGTTAVHRLFADSSHELPGEKFIAGLAAGRYDDFFNFAFVRNLWDRLVSCYLQKLGPGASDNAIAKRFARRGEVASASSPISCARRRTRGPTPTSAHITSASSEPTANSCRTSWADSRTWPKTSRGSR